MKNSFVFFNKCSDNFDFILFYTCFFKEQNVLCHRIAS